MPNKLGKDLIDQGSLFSELAADDARSPLGGAPEHDAIASDPKTIGAPAAPRPPDLLHGLRIGHDFQRLHNALHAFGRKQKSHHLVVACDGDRLVSRLPHQLGEPGLGRCIGVTTSLKTCISMRRAGPRGLAPCAPYSHKTHFPVAASCRARMGESSSPSRRVIRTARRHWRAMRAGRRSSGPRQRTARMR